MAGPASTPPRSRATKSKSKVPYCGCGRILQRNDSGRWTCPAGCWFPNKGPQTRFLSLTCFEALYGGAAGGGKSDALLVDAVRYVGRGYGSSYQALLLRREFPDLEKSLIVRSHDLYPRLGGKYREDKKFWRFPAGERVYFGHAQYEKDICQYQGAAFQYVGFDELTTFTRFQYLYMVSRVRSAHGIPLRLRGATNPGGEGHEWVFKRFGPWLDPKHEVQAAPGQVLYFALDADDTEHVVPKGTPGALGRVFVPARIADNPYLAEDGQYETGLRQLDPVTRARLRDGDWLIMPAEGLYFRRGWVQIVDAAPADAVRVRGWDLAATEKTESNNPDATSGIRMSRSRDGIFYVEDRVWLQASPGTVRQTVINTAEADGKAVAIFLPQDPGQAGKDQAQAYVSALAGFNVRTAPVTGDKITRFAPFSAQAEAGNVRIVRGDWNEAFFRELERFPVGHDDDADATSQAFQGLFQAPARIRPPSSGRSSRFGSSARGF